MYLYGLVIGISLVIGIDYCTKRNNIIPKSKEIFFITGLLSSAIIGARTYHVVDQWTFYSKNLFLIPQTWNGGLGIFGAIMAAFIFILSFCFFYKINIIKVLDLITPILPLCQSVGRLGNWINKENPAWWIEAIPDLILFFLIARFPKNPTAKYLIGYGIIRFASEYFRNDTWTINSIKIGQIISLIFVILGVNLIYRERHQISQNHRQQHSLDT
jgi:phosphatidylglycerol---prolipoprotein diacylglyceryl transferase